MNAVELKSGRIIIHPVTQGIPMGVYLQISKNLSDLASVATALNNLGLGWMSFNVPGKAMTFDDLNNKTFMYIADNAGNGRTLYDELGTRALLFSSGSRTLMDDAGNSACDWANRVLYDNAGNPAMTWQSTTAYHLNDISGLSLDWQNRECYLSDHETVSFTWDVPEVWSMNGGTLTAMQSEMSLYPNTLNVINGITQILENYGMLTIE